MTIVRSLGVTTLVALMAAHRVAAEQPETRRMLFRQAAMEADPRIRPPYRDATRDPARTVPRGP